MPFNITWSLHGDEELPKTAKWHPEPLVRGTQSILVGSLVTLSLCVWTTLHLNIPPHGATTWTKLKRKIGWLFIGIILPEYVLYVAVIQWLSAQAAHQRILISFANHGLQKPPILSRRQELWKTFLQSPVMSGLDCDIQDEVSRVESHSGDIELEEYGATPEPLPRRRQNPWTIRHTYYLRMGGFVFNPSLLFTGNDGNPSPDALRAELGARLSLTAQGVVFLSKHASDLIPDISEADIVDKSNADNFSRVLAIAQASWFLFQFIARLFVGLPVTILELNVVAHIIYAVLIFLFWWEKPLDIDLPTYVPAKSSKDFSLLAAMYTRSRIGYMQRVDGYHSLMNPHAAFLDLAPVVSEPGPRHGTDTPDTPALNDHDGTNEYPETAESRTSQLSLPFQISLGQARHGVKMVAWSHAHIFRYSKLRAAILRTPRTVLGHHVMFDCDSTGCECSKSPDFLNKARVTICRNSGTAAGRLPAAHVEPEPD